MVLSRFLLNLRGLYFSTSADSQTEPCGATLIFRRLNLSAQLRSNIVGNLGATVGGDAEETDAEHEEAEERYCNDPFMEGMRTSVPRIGQPSFAGSHA